jgi:hypothetical protein
MRNKLLAALGLAAVLLAGPAGAADLGSYKDAPGGDRRETALSWTGFFVGGSAGYSIYNTAMNLGGFEIDGIGSEGFNGCGIVGARRQLGSVVGGIEGRGCISNISTDLSIGGVSIAGFDQDYSAAAYLTAGVNVFGGLGSLVGGYKIAHVNGSGLLGGLDEQFQGFSGGLMWETKITPNMNLGLEALYDKYDEKTIGGVAVDPSGLNVAFRLTIQTN